MRASTRLNRVDGNSNALVDLSPGLFEDEDLSEEIKKSLSERTSDGWYRVKLGAAAARYLADLHGLDERARSWPRELPSELGEMIVPALPHAFERITFI